MSNPPSNLDFEKPDALVGKTLDGRFLIQKNLTEGGADEGGIGLVYLARDTKLLNKLVVVKILKEAALKHDDIVRKFLHEKEALIRLDHPGIVRILDSGTLQDGNPFMVMEFIEGHSLRKELQKRKQLPLVIAAHIIESVTDALAAAHAKNIVHRDIKPENIMLTPQEDGLDRVRLIDFGIARVGDSQLAPETSISRAIGTILYIPPEQLIGSLDLTPAVDIYATAIVAYEMLAGELPFKPRAIVEMYQMEKDGVKVPPSDLRPDLPRGAERVLLSALEFEPAKRPQNARTFGRHLASELLTDSMETDKFYASVKTEYAEIPPEMLHHVSGRNRPTAESELAVTRAVEPPVVVDPVVEGDEDEYLTVSRTEAVKTETPFPKLLKWGLPAAAGLVLLLIGGVYFALNALKSAPGVDNRPVATAAPAAGDREFFYFLTVQKMRDGKPFEEPFRSSGQEVFESGYKFNIVFQSQAEGYIYLFNEGRDESGKLGYYLLFPTPSVNDGSPQVIAGQQIQTAQNTFTGKTGTEIMWMIWTKQQDDVIAGVTQAALSDKGSVDDQNGEVLRSFLDKHGISKPETTKDTVNQRTIVKASGDVVVHRFEIEHR